MGSYWIQVVLGVLKSLLVCLFVSKFLFLFHRMCSPQKIFFGVLCGVAVIYIRYDDKG